MMRFVAWAVLTVFLGVMTVSLVHVGTMAADGGGMIDCMFMDHTEEICPMSYADHLGAWKDAFSAVVPAIIVLAIVYAAAALSPWLAALFRYRPPARIGPVSVRDAHRRDHDPLRRLFARGILHPKVYEPFQSLYYTVRVIRTLTL